MGAMESLPEHQQTPNSPDMWWGENPTSAENREQTSEQEMQSEHRNGRGLSSTNPSGDLTERLESLQLSHTQEITSLITTHETELATLREKLSHSESEKTTLQSEIQTIKSTAQISENECENLKIKILELNNLIDKLQYIESEYNRLKDNLNTNLLEDELKKQVSQFQCENNNLKSQLVSLESQCSDLKVKVTDVEALRSSLENIKDECERLKRGQASSSESQFEEARQDYERLQVLLKSEEARWAAEMEQKSQQAKWEMTSLQTCVDNLFKENTQLRNDLTQVSHKMTESREKHTTNELYVEKLTEQVTALKDVVSIGKQMLGMRDNEVEQLQRKNKNLEDMLETEREKTSLISSAFSPEPNGNLRREYETQLENIRSLKTIYGERAEIQGLENQALKDTLADKNTQIDLMTKRYADIEAQYYPLKELYKEKEDLVRDLEKRVSMSTEECRSLTNQLTLISNLFTELGKTDVDMDKLRSLQDAMAEHLSENTNTDNAPSNLTRVWCALSDLLANSSVDTPTPVEGSEGCYKSVNTPYGPRLVISVSQTFLRLKDLILEKKSLTKELGQLRHLNTHLETKLQQQEKRLSLVLTELKKTWGVVNKMRSQHSQLRTSEAILRYDLQQKRKIVNELKEELEYCREIWQQARNKTAESEEQWRELRDEFASRRRRPLNTEDSTEMNSGESGYSDGGRGEDESGGSSTSDCEENTGDLTGSEKSSDSKSPDILPLSSSLSDPFIDSNPDVIDTIEPQEEIKELSSIPSSSQNINSKPSQSNEKPSNSKPSNQEENKAEEGQSSMSPRTGAIRKVLPPRSDLLQLELDKLNEERIPANTEEVKIEGDEVLDARAARLKRLEEQCSQLFKRVVRTSNMSVAIANRLEELHEHYGESEENRESAARRRLRSESDRNSESENSQSDSIIPNPPPLPSDIPSIRLPTAEIEQNLLPTDLPNIRLSTPEINDVETECNFEIPTTSKDLLENQNENLDFRIPSPMPAPLALNYSQRLTERVRQRLASTNIPEIEGTTSQDEQDLESHGSQNIEVSNEKKELAEKLEAEKKQKDLLSVELGQVRDTLANRNQELLEMRTELTNQRQFLVDMSESKAETETKLHTLQAECTDLRRQVEQLKADETKLRSQLAELQEVTDSRSSELQQLQGDVTQLHESIIRLTRQKDALFKECYVLKQANRERAWQADSQVTQCSACRVTFSLLVRRHHCRLCGRIFCGACSSHWVAAHGETSRRTRSCSECHSKNQHQGAAAASSGTSDLTQRGDDSSGSSMSGSMVTADEELAAGVDNVEDEDEGEEEDFSVISEEEVVLSQCVPYSPNPEILTYWKSCEIQSGLARNVAAMIAANEKVSESVWVRAGVIYAVPLLLSAEDCAPQVNVTWEFTTEPKCIAFSVLYKKDADIPTENSSILVPTTRVNSHLHPIRGRLRARREGLYTLLFDNSYSRFTGKKVNFSLTCEVGTRSGRSSVGPDSPVKGVSKSPSRDFDSPDREFVDSSSQP